MLLPCLVLYVFLTRTDLGRAIRATGQDREVARLMGIDDEKIYGVAYGLSAALMAIAAAVLVPFFYVHPGVGTSFLLKVFVIVVLGGIGSMPGAAIGGLLGAASRASSASTAAGRLRPDVLVRDLRRGPLRAAAAFSAWRAVTRASRRSRRPRRCRSRGRSCFR